MSHPLDSVESYLKVGQSVIFYPEAQRQDGNRHETIVRGWQHGGYILLEVTPLPTRSIVFRENAECSLRFLKDGVACSMEASIIDWQVSRKKPTFTVSWPKSVRTASVRRNERVDVHIPCTMHFQDGETEGAVQDLSVGGCGIISPKPCDRDTSIVVSVTLPDGVYVDKAPLIVRNVREVREIREGRFYLGCMLDNSNPLARASIEFYVTTSLLRARGLTDASPIILILDPDLQENDAIPQSLKQEGFEVHVRSNLIDGISCARLRLPAAMLVKNNWNTATALDFCRVLNTSPALETIPLIIYDAPDNAHAQLLEAGAESCHATMPDIASIMTLARTETAIPSAPPGTP